MTDIPAMTSTHPHTPPLSTILTHQHPYRTIPRSNLSPSNIPTSLPTPQLPPPSSTIRTQCHPHHIPSSNHQYNQPSYTSQQTRHLHPPQQLNHHHYPTSSSLPTFPTVLSSQSAIPRQICNPIPTQPSLPHHSQSPPHLNLPSTDLHIRPELPQQPTKYRRLETSTHITNIRRIDQQTLPTHLPSTPSPFNYPILSSAPRARYDPVSARDDGYSTGSRETAPAPDGLEDDHDIEAPYTCAHCAARFTDREQRKNHIKTAHEKPFVCVACNSRFTRKFDLEKHSLTVHEGMRPFQCDLCSSSFGQKHHLVRHKRAVHAKARDFACDSCSSRFARKEHLGNHKRAVHEKHKPFMCSLCDVQYYERRALRKHLEQVHSVKSTRASMLAEWQPNGNNNAPSIRELVQM